MEVIHPYEEGTYPFKKENSKEDTTYLQYQMVCHSEEQLKRYKEISNVLKNFPCKNIIQFIKVLKSSNNLYMLYEYYDQSLTEWLKNNGTQKTVQKVLNQLKFCYLSLINAGIKAQIELKNIAIDQNNEIKVFFPPEIGINQSKSELQQNYQIQEAKVALEIEELLDSMESKVNFKKLRRRQTNQPLFPNFYVKGNTLCFLNEIKKIDVRQKSPVKVVGNLHKCDSFEKDLKMEQTSDKGNEEILKKRDMDGRIKQLLDKAGKKDLLNNNSNATTTKKLEEPQKVKRKSWNFSHPEAGEEDSQKISLNFSNEQAINSLHKSVNQEVLESELLKKLSQAESEGRPEVIHKYTMKIVISQEVELEVGENDDIEKIAEAELRKYQKLYGEDTHVEINTSHDKSHNSNEKAPSNEKVNNNENVNDRGNYQDILDRSKAQRAKIIENVQARKNESKAQMQ